jgi:hypothetical protein
VQQFFEIAALASLARSPLFVLASLNTAPSLRSLRSRVPLDVNPATKTPFSSRRQDHFAANTLLSTPGNGDFWDQTMNLLWLSGTSTCIFRSLPVFFSKLMLPS